ncbi:3-hydroxybutyryl-CoA dehydrogenase [Rathayibacter sp. AY1B1]|uniref:3-hydroxyacyl-CoA dehydrogenase n=1 Tax=unclassified Rathayibacter TaxID=2609250 RepID=UPI000CE7EAD2|nr:MULTISPECIES: 3-hydroxyacyl-CoA dehydrogenase [unclassified Rathayibacter]PPI24947.1 3-hydroxybutyryl-CoA dehydrogenase [Rathayibacter sp. AY1B6]PPI39426.1 3-hydroxybutyryl-CoA dehydrogenase [Rathayibacter sp. AY1B1]
MPTIRTVTVLGSGVLGSQIAFQSAFHGFAVTVYDLSDEVLESARERLRGLSGVYESVPGGVAGGPQEALDSLRLTSDLAEAVADADLVIEAVPEDLSVKQELYGRLGALAPERTVFATNSSTLLPSDLKASTGRPDRFLALHYANHVWAQNTAEIMGTADTDPAVVDAVVEFAVASGLEPVRLQKEKAGYVLNSLLVPLLNAASGLLMGGYADHETIDKTWRIGTGAPLGPFQIFDVVGLRTAYTIAAAAPDEASQAFAAHLKTEYLDRGRLGTATGEGFYRY